MDFEYLVDLGVSSKFDVSNIQKGTQNAMRSHIKLLRRNSVELSRELVESEDMNTLLDSLVNTKNEKLSPEYKVQIAATLKRLYGSTYEH